MSQQVSGQHFPYNSPTFHHILPRIVGCPSPPILTLNTEPHCLSQPSVRRMIHPISWNTACSHKWGLNNFIFAISEAIQVLQLAICYQKYFFSTLPLENCWYFFESCQTKDKRKTYQTDISNHHTSCATPRLSRSTPNLPTPPFEVKTGFPAAAVVVVVHHVDQILRSSWPSCGLEMQKNPRSVSPGADCSYIWSI